MIIFIASLTLDRPIRSWLILGRWLPLLVGYFVISFWLIFPRYLFSFAKRAAKILPVIVVLGIGYASVFLWRFYIYDAKAHIAAQHYRAVFEQLSRLPAGVVMTSPDTSELIALYTPHRVYWSRMNGQFGATYEELARRLHDERLMFDDARLGTDFGKSSIFGAANFWCGQLTEKLFYRTLRKMGILDVTTCNTRLSDRDWPKYIAEYSQAKEEISRDTLWQPSYRLDWLLVHEGKDAISHDIIQRYFEKVESVGNFTIYRYVHKN